MQWMHLRRHSLGSNRKYIMETFLRGLEHVFLYSSSASNIVRAFQLSSAIGCVYVLFLLAFSLGWLKLRPVPGAIMFTSPLSIVNAFIFLTLQLSRISYGQTTGVATTGSDASGATATSAMSMSSPAALVVNGSTTSFRPLFTVPPSASVGANLIPNVLDPQAVDAQSVCPGYTAANVLRTPYGLTAILDLAGKACNLYGTDIETLNLTVAYQSADRLSVRVTPAIVDASNFSQYILPSHLIYQPTIDADANSTILTNDLQFLWSNDPTFTFSVFRISTGDTLFSTLGTKLVYENQFIEFASSLPENYNLYGLGETIHGLQLGNNFTKTIYAADIGDPID